MHAIELAGPSIDSPRRARRPDPADPGPGRVLVRMRAAGLNFLDLAVAKGTYPGAPYPIVPLADGAGEVVAVGPGVWQVAVGDRVATHSKPRWVGGRGTAAMVEATRGVNLPGALVEVADLDAASVARAPDHLGWEAIAALPIPATTAWNALVAADAGPGSTVVLLGTGGVSIAALQLAKARGARVLVTSSSDEKLERARALGADEVHNYRADPAWDAFVIERTGGVGADLVLETVGGEGFARSLAAVRYGGTVFTVGFLGGTEAALDIIAVIRRGVRVQGIQTGSAADLAAALAAVAAHRIEPVIDRAFDADELSDAYRLMERGGHFGKIAVRIGW